MAKNYAKEIERLEQLLDSGATSVSTDGLTTTFDREGARRRLAELRRLQGDDLTKVKRKVSTLNISQCW